MALFQAIGKSNEEQRTVLGSPELAECRQLLMSDANNKIMIGLTKAGFPVFLQLTVKD